MASYRSEKPYVGAEKIVIGFDIGTTMSAASYAFLASGSHTTVEMVTQWPGQPTASGSAKIPTLVTYEGSRCVACGQEALDYPSDGGNVQTAKWFKLHMHPESLRNLSMNIPPLPSGIGIKRVYKDMISYMVQNTQRHFESKMPNGAAIWRRLRNSMEFIFAIPNGWDFTQQKTMREAAIDANLFPSHKADTLLRFVTEGEASVHFVSVYGSIQSWLQVGSTFGVIDAGGSTTDSTLYTCTKVSPTTVLKEAGLSECVQAAGVNVDDVLSQLLKAKLANSKFGDDESIQAIIEAFEQKTKRLFDGNNVSNIIKFGGAHDHDKSVGIFKGQISLKKEEVLAAFSPVLENIIESVRRLMRSNQPQYLLLVGGFGESPYLKSRLEQLFGGQGINFVTVEQPTKKAAAEGAVIWYIKNLVKARVARETFGTDATVNYNSSLHSSRKHRAFRYADGKKSIEDTFSIWVKKGTVVDDDYSHTIGYSYNFRDKPKLGIEEVDVYMWEGDNPPLWAKEENGKVTPGLKRICTVKADLSPMNSRGVESHWTLRGRYWSAKFDVAITLPIGGAQLQARIQWREQGVLKQGPLTTILNFDS